jgi:proteasome lid subunit RPN8/RPN11
MAIQVILEDHTGNNRQQAKLSETATVDKLIRAIITTLKMPVTDSAGRVITYYLAHNNRRLQENDTLSSAEVRENDTISIVPQMTAGALSDPSFYEQSLVVLEDVSDHRVPTVGFPAEYPVDASSTTTQVSFHPDLLERVQRQAKAYLTEEVGGILIGHVYEDDGRFLVQVEDILPANHTIASIASLTFTDQTWLDLLRQRRMHDDQFVTGWYHSHPGFGIFLSSSDLSIHQHFFCAQSWYLALVVDPLSDAWGVFGWENGEVTRCSQQ